MFLDHCTHLSYLMHCRSLDLLIMIKINHTYQILSQPHPSRTKTKKLSTIFPSFLTYLKTKVIFSFIDASCASSSKREKIWFFISSKINTKIYQTLLNYGTNHLIVTRSILQCNCSYLKFMLTVPVKNIFSSKSQSLS